MVNKNRIWNVWCWLIDLEYFVSVFGKMFFGVRNKVLLERVGFVFGYVIFVFLYISILVEFIFLFLFGKEKNYCFFYILGCIYIF